jgi:Tfp pilus assembly protein PilE
MENKENTRKTFSGFTIIELMIIVGILAVLAAVAIPAYITYMKRSKSSEAAVTLKAICKGASSYFTTEINGATNRQPANTTQTPAEDPHESKYVVADKAPEFTNPTQPNALTWMALGWAPQIDFYYAYSYTQTCGTDTCHNGEDHFYGVARGDLDGDKVFAVFTRSGDVIEGQMTCADLIAVRPTE